MATFGNIKNKILVKLTESYGKEDFKGNLNTYFKPITKSDTLKEMYSLYEELEGKTFEDKETATLYVEELSKILKEKEDLETKFTELTESINSKLDSIVESDVEFKSKSEDVKTEINEMNQSKYNLYRLEELLDNLLD